jgi:SNF family Na+-dependent transporter
MFKIALFFRFKKFVMTNTRATWNNKADFILALFSYGVGLGNVWR